MEAIHNSSSSSQHRTSTPPYSLHRTTSHVSLCPPLRWQWLSKPLSNSNEAVGSRFLFIFDMYSAPLNIHSQVSCFWQGQAKAVSIGQNKFLETRGWKFSRGPLTFANRNHSESMKLRRDVGQIIMVWMV